MAVVSLTFRGNEPFYLGGWRKSNGVYVFETEVINGRSMTLRVCKMAAPVSINKWYWTASEGPLVTHHGLETRFAQAKISALLAARRVLIGPPSLRDQLTQRQNELIAPMGSNEALAVACTQLLTEQPEFEAEIEAVYAELVAEVEAGLASRRDGVTAQTEAG